MHFILWQPWKALRPSKSKGNWENSIYSKLEHELKEFVPRKILFPENTILWILTKFENEPSPIYQILLLDKSKIWFSKIGIPPIEIYSTFEESANELSGIYSIW